MMTPTAHEKSEWTRFAQAALAAGYPEISIRFSVAALIAPDGRMSAEHFDDLQRSYRQWLCFGLYIF